VSGLQTPDSHATKLERGTRILRQAILRGDLQPGQRLKQQDLADQLGMSSTPVREVLRVLESEGLLERIPYKGVYVAEVSPEEVKESAPIRAVLEKLAVELAVPQLTSREIERLERLNRSMEEALTQMDFVQIRKLNYDLHITIYQASGSPMLVNMIERLWPKFATNVLWMIPGRAQRSIQQHRAIIQAIKEGDANRAAALVAEHIHTAGHCITDFLKTTKQSTVFPVASVELDENTIPYKDSSEETPR